MKSHPAIKILVILFSLSLASYVIWQMTSNMSGEKTETQNTPESSPNTKKEEPPMIMGTKSPGGSVRLKDVEDQLSNPDKEESKKTPPILPGSKSGIFLPPSNQQKAAE